MKFSWEKVKRPILCLAPMAGFTDSAFRQIVKGIEPNIICFSELTSSHAIAYNSEKTVRMLEFSKKEQPIIMQLFGNNPDFFAESGRKAEEMGASGIDINMGCPVPKVTKNFQGSALLKQPELAAEIVRKLVKAVKIPVSVKLRLGYSKYYEEDFLDFVKRLEQAGASLLTIHGRTAKQGYIGTPDFEPIYLAKKHLKIPIIGNGNIDSPEKALKMLSHTYENGETITLDGLMVGRASIGNPWIMKEIYKALQKPASARKSQTTSTSPSSTSLTSKPTTSSPLSIHKKLPTIKKHLKLSIKVHGQKTGILECRKHLAKYISNAPNASKIRTKLMTEENVEEILKILEML